MRAFPILVFLVITYYLLLPLLGVRVEPFKAAAVAFSLKHGVYFGEVYRSAWLAVERGQLLAASSLGCRNWRTNWASSDSPESLSFFIPTDKSGRFCPARFAICVCDRTSKYSQRRGLQRRSCVIQRLLLLQS